MMKRQGFSLLEVLMSLLLSSSFTLTVLQQQSDIASLLHESLQALAAFMDRENRR